MPVRPKRRRSRRFYLLLIQPAQAARSAWLSFGGAAHQTLGEARRITAFGRREGSMSAQVPKTAAACCLLSGAPARAACRRHSNIPRHGSAPWSCTASIQQRCERLNQRWRETHMIAKYSVGTTWTLYTTLGSVWNQTFFQKSLSHQNESYYFILLNKICL